MKRLLITAILGMFAGIAIAQEADTIPKKGSYLFYGQPAIEDNSMLIEEAFNQEAGIIQHISNFIFSRGEFVYAYTQEIPLADVKHQFSFGLSYASFGKPKDPTLLNNSNYLTRGLGDLFLNYRPLIWGKNDWALVIPRFTVIVPTGNARYGFGTGGLGGQFNLAVTKRLNRKITTHYNMGYTYMTSTDHYTFSGDGTPVLTFEKNIGSTNVGMSAIWLVHPKFNLMLEYTSLFGKEIQDDGSFTKANNTVLNPGFRFAVDIGKVQIVPGAGVPVNFSNGAFEGTGGFIYLSIEPAY